MVFASNPTGLWKSKQPYQFWPVFQWFFKEIQPDHENQSKPFNFDPFLNGVCKKSNQATQIETNFSILTRVWMVFAGSPTRPRKSKQSFQFWPTFEWFLQEIQLGHANRSKLLNFDPLLNGFCKKSNQGTQIETNFSSLTRFWMLFVRNATRPCKSKQPFQFWSVFEWFLQEIQLGFTNRSKLFKFDPFLNGFCKKSY